MRANSSSWAERWGQVRGHGHSGEQVGHRGKLRQTVMNGQGDEKTQPYLLPLVISDSRMLIRILIVNISSGEAPSIFSSLLLPADEFLMGCSLWLPTRCDEI